MVIRKESYHGKKYSYRQCDIGYYIRSKAVWAVFNGQRFPEGFDSGEGGDIEQTMRTAKSAYYAQLSTNYANTNPARVMTTVTLEMANGQQILRESIGGFPVIEPEEPAEQEEPTEE